MPSRRQKKNKRPYKVYKYTQGQIDKFCNILRNHCILHYILGDERCGCLKITNMDQLISPDEWSDFAAYPKCEVKAYVIVFIISRGYYPINLKKHKLCISHPCGAHHSL